MCSIEIWYLWYIFYTKFVYILCKFYLVRSFDYSWNNNLIMLLCKRNICFILENFVLLLSHFLVISTANISKVVSMLFSQNWSNTINKLNFHFQPNIKVEPALIYRRWINVIFSMLFQRCFINVETTPINIRRLNFHFQPNFNVETTLFYRHWIDVILSTLFQRYFANVETMSINVRRLNFHFQPNINVETTLMNVDDQRCFNIESTLMCLLGVKRLVQNLSVVESISSSLFTFCISWKFNNCWLIWMFSSAI